MTSRRPEENTPRRVDKPFGKTWCWTRRIAALEQDRWIVRLQRSGVSSWTITQKPGQATALVAAYLPARPAALRFHGIWGGRVHAILAANWLAQGPSAILKIGSRLEIRRESPPPSTRKVRPSLHLPHGLAFGSGEHATTFMLLRALTDWPTINCDSILDLGTGSGVLALAARLLGAEKITATDFDAEAIRTARANEQLNFPAPLIRWRQANVKRLRAQGRYGLVMANLFSGILCQASGPIAACVAESGELWLSGILHAQADEVVRAYRGRNLRLRCVVRRGKWVMLQWRKPTRKPAR